MKASEIKRTLVLSLVSHFALILPLLVSGCVLRIIKNWIKSSARQYCNLQFAQTAEAEVPNQRSKIDICSSSVGQPNTIGGMPQSNRLAHKQRERERQRLESGQWTGAERALGWALRYMQMLLVSFAFVQAASAPTAGRRPPWGK